MIIAENTSSSVISNVLAAPTKFKIKASAKAFKILSGFYSEPILAIPRELGANAWDSHVKAGNTKQMFEVHAPNTLEPWFAIRDFGTGLSPEAIDTIYTTYFESTKTSDNDSDGCMGLGSKTPFNYTDNFNVTSFQNGKKYVYNCFIDDTGSPNIMQIASVNTDEPNGLEIKFGVKISDISMWIEKISRAYEPFRYRPIIKGASIKYPERKYIYQGTNWAMRENKDYNTRVSYAFMGNYCYPISSDIVTNMLYRNDNDHKFASLLNYGSFDFFFNIGDLEVAPNKEQLQYDDTNNKTSNAIIAALKVARNELDLSVKKNIEIPKTRWDAMGLYLKYNSHNSPHHAIRSILGDIPIFFNGTRVDSSGFSFAPSLNTANLFVNKNTEPHVFDVLHLEGRVVKKFKKIYSLHTSIDKEVLVYYTNEPSIKKARVMHHIRSNGFAEKRNIFVFIDTSSGAKNIHALINHFGWSKSQVINIESLPKPPPTPREKKVVATNEIHVHSLEQMRNYVNSVKNVRYSVPNVDWRRTSGTFNGADTYYYVDFLYNDPIWNGNSIGEQLTEIVRMFVKANLHGAADQIYGINKKNQHLLKVGNWVNVIDLVKSKVIDTNKSQHENYVYMVNEFEKFKTCSYLHNKLHVNKDIIRGIKSNDTKKFFSDFVETYNFLSNNANSACSDVMRLFNVSPVCHIALNCDLNKFKEIMSKKYMNILELGTGYGETASIYYNIINYIDETS